MQETFLYTYLCKYRYASRSTRNSSAARRSERARLLSLFVDGFTPRLFEICKRVKNTTSQSDFGHFGNNSVTFFSNKMGFSQNTDLLLTPLLTPYKIDRRIKFIKAQNYQWDRFKFTNRFSLPDFFLRWCTDGGLLLLLIADFGLSSPLIVNAGFLLGKSSKEFLWNISSSKILSPRQYSNLKWHVIVACDRGFSSN